MIGRERETKDLNNLYDCGRAELVAIYFQLLLLCEVPLFFTLQSYSPI